MRARAVAAIALCAALGVANAGHAIGQKPQIEDPAGDAVGGRPSLDIVSGTFDTTGTVVGKGRRAKYTPTSFVGTLTLAAPPETGPGFAYNLRADVAGCGYFRLSYAPGTLFASLVGPATLFTECGSPPDETGSTATLFVVDATVSGNSITFSVGLKTLPEEIKVGRVFSNLHAAIDVIDPVLGATGPGTETGAVWVDSATSTKTWKLG